METNSFFNINRLKYLLVRQFSINYKTMLIAVGAVAGFLMFIGTVTILAGHKPMVQENILGLIMPTIILVGLIYSSMVFSELNSSNRGYLYLTLPASSFEKLIIAWLLTSVLYSLFGIIMLLIINLYFILVAELFNSQAVQLVNIFSVEVLKPFGVYMVVQSVFLLGAIYFRRINFLKTILAWFVFILAISFYSGFLAKILFGTMSVEPKNLEHSLELKFTVENQVVPVAKFLFWFALAPFFLIVSYFRLKERQV